MLHSPLPTLGSVNLCLVFSFLFAAAIFPFLSSARPHNSRADFQYANSFLLKQAPITRDSPGAPSCEVSQWALTLIIVEHMPGYDTSHQ